MPSPGMWLHARCPLRVCLTPLHGRVAHPLRSPGEERLLPRQWPEKSKILPSLTQNVSGWRDVQPIRALSLCSQATSSSDSLPVKTHTKHIKTNESNGFVSEREHLSAEKEYLSDPLYVATNLSTRWWHCITNV